MHDIESSATMDTDESANTMDTADAIITKLGGGSQGWFQRILEDAKAHQETLTIFMQDADRTYLDVLKDFVLCDRGNS